MNQSHNLEALIDAGITSFKIEGRLKDLSYVKNVTAHYRQLLDQILDARSELTRASSGRVEHFFQPQPEKSFNRGATDYFLHGRQPDIVNLRTPKFIGEAIGKVAKCSNKSLEIDNDTPIENGDGLCFFDANQQLVGFRINRAAGRELFLHEIPTGLLPGTLLYRNGDTRFDKQMEKPSAKRRIRVDLTFSATENGFALSLCDEDGICANAEMTQNKDLAQKPEQALTTIREQISKLGGSDFAVRKIEINLPQVFFIASSALNALRREAISQLEIARLTHYQRPTARMGGRINTIMQTCFFALSSVLPRDEAIAQIKKAIEKTYSRKGRALVEKNFAAVDQTLAHLEAVKIPSIASASRDLPATVPDDAPDFVKRVTAMVPGWFDKFLPWRHADAARQARTILIAPSRAYLQHLPQGKLPDRSDFKSFAGHDQQRRQYWRQATAESQRLGDAFCELVASGRIAAVARPLFDD